MQPQQANVFHHNSAFATERWRQFLHIMITMFFCSRRTDAFRHTDGCAARGNSRIPEWTSSFFRPPACFLRLLSLSGSRTFCRRSSLLNDRCTFQGTCSSNCEQTCRILLRVELFMLPPEFMTTMRRPGRLFKIRESTAHDKRIGLEHTPRNFTTANIDHRMCETIGKF